MEPRVAQCLRYCSGSGNGEKHPKVHSPREPCGMWRTQSDSESKNTDSTLAFCRYVSGSSPAQLAFLLLCLQSRQPSHSKFYFSVLGEYEQQLLSSAHLGLR